MQGLIRMIVVSGIILLGLITVTAVPGVADDHPSFVIVYKDGHRQSLSTEQIERINIKAPAGIVYKDGRREKMSGEIERIEFSESAFSARTPSRAHYVGKWEVREEPNGSRFYITLEENGDARKSIGATHGTWTLVDGEARINWDDGWHDVICKVGTQHEKRAYAPGRSFDDEPSNVTEARNTTAKPI